MQYQVTLIKTGQLVSQPWKLVCFIFPPQKTQLCGLAQDFSAAVSSSNNNGKKPQNVAQEKWEADNKGIWIESLDGETVLSYFLFLEIARFVCVR